MSTMKEVSLEIQEVMRYLAERGVTFDTPEQYLVDAISDIENRDLVGAQSHYMLGMIATLARSDDEEDFKNYHENYNNFADVAKYKPDLTLNATRLVMKGMQMAAQDGVIDCPEDAEKVMRVLMMRDDRIGTRFVEKGEALMTAVDMLVDESDCDECSHRNDCILFDTLGENPGARVREVAVKKYHELRDLLHPDITETIDDLEKDFDDSHIGVKLGLIYTMYLTAQGQGGLSVETMKQFNEIMFDNDDPDGEIWDIVVKTSETEHLVRDVRRMNKRAKSVVEKLKENDVDLKEAALTLKKLKEAMDNEETTKKKETKTKPIVQINARKTVGKITLSPPDESDQHLFGIN